MLQRVYPDNLGRIQKPNGAGIQGLHLDYKVRIIQGWTKSTDQQSESLTDFAIFNYFRLGRGLSLGAKIFSSFGGSKRERVCACKQTCEVLLQQPGINYNLRILNHQLLRLLNRSLLHLQWPGSLALTAQLRSTPSALAPAHTPEGR